MTINKKAYQTQRYAGMLLHISSLPSKGYIGDLGENAYRMVDLLAEIGVSVWQTLPINMPHADFSPYQCISAFAGNTEFISLELLVKEALLTQSDVDGFYHSQARNKNALIKYAYHAFIKKQDQQEFEQFCQDEANWLDDYALFLVLRNQFNLQAWVDWPETYKNRDPETLLSTRKMMAEEIAEVKFAQFIFFKQWHQFKHYASSKAVHLFGDIPIFVAYDSAEVWAKPALFKLDADKKMTVVAGVPPDYFSETGQRWGNPHYAWEKMAEDGYQWWVDRLATQNKLFDLVRIDHFRGLEAAWEINADEDTAINGQWVTAPGEALLDAIYAALPDIHLVAEDLGIITEQVDALRMKYEMPGMKILQFAFGGDDSNPYLPNNIDQNSVVYTGTHDNDTTLGWYLSLDEGTKTHVSQYVDSPEVAMPQDLMVMAFEAHAYLAIVPMQDILALDSAARMNTPGTVVGNWLWRFEWAQLTNEQITFMKTAIASAGRAQHG